MAQYLERTDSARNSNEQMGLMHTFGLYTLGLIVSVDGIPFTR